VDDFFSRVWDDLIGRVFGPMKFRLVLQPLVAIIFAIRAAIKDAREGNPPYFLALFNSANHRINLLKSGWKDVGRVFIFAILIDAVYQFIFVRWVYPGQLLIVAIVLAIVPYLLIRGPLNRILRRTRLRRGPGHRSAIVLRGDMK
jgi:hypothetical protein